VGCHLTREVRDWAIGGLCLQNVALKKLRPQKTSLNAEEISNSLKRSQDFKDNAPTYVQGNPPPTLDVSDEFRKANVRMLEVQKAGFTLLHSRDYMDQSSVDSADSAKTEGAEEGALSPSPEPSPQPEDSASQCSSPVVSSCGGAETPSNKNKRMLKYMKATGGVGSLLDRPS
jgi:hypothetical protein